MAALVVKQALAIRQNELQKTSPLYFTKTNSFLPLYFAETAQFLPLYFFNHEKHITFVADNQFVKK